MTVVFSAASSEWIVMAADSTITREFTDSREYDTDRKLWAIDGVGVLSTWGARDGNLIGRFLSSQWSSARDRSVSDLARDVHGYLVKEYRPDERGAQDVGYHIAGFLADGAPALFHSYFHSPRDATSHGNYDFQSIGPKGRTRQFLYNGRNDLAHSLITSFLNDLNAGKETRFGVGSVAEIAYLAHFVMRVASEITPEVGPPFRIHVILPGGFARTKTYSDDRVAVDGFRRDFDDETTGKASVSVSSPLTIVALDERSKDCSLRSL